MDSTLQLARSAMYESGDYDRAVRILEENVDWNGTPDARLRDAYLLLIESIVYLGNAAIAEPGGYSTAKILYDRARAKIAELLRVKELRQTRPDSLFAPETRQFFTEVRRQTLGGFVASSLDPPDATVVLDGDTLGVLPDLDRKGDLDLLAGPHALVVHRAGYHDFTDTIRIEPGVTASRDLALRKRRGWKWFATRGTGVAALAGGVVALVAGGGGESTPPLEPLPGPPDPPARP